LLGGQHWLLGKQGICAPLEQKMRWLRREIFNRLRQLRRNSLFALEQGIPRSKTGNEYEICSEFEVGFSGDSL